MPGPLELVLLGAAAVAVAGFLGSRLAAAGAVLGGAAASIGAVRVLASGLRAELSATWEVPGGALAVGLDPLGAFFLVPLFVVGALAAVYGAGYARGRPRLAAGVNLLIAAMALVVLARHALLFLVAWEVMTLLAFLLVTADDDDAAVRRAGWAYLIASHLALVALLAAFVGLGRFDFSPQAGAPALVLVFALVGFGTKAGVVGLHVWLPEAHAAAPAHVSALMSGVLVNMGLYGLLRMTLLVTPGPWLGVTLMIAGVAGALVGIALALQAVDIKRVLAYSTVENVGIILVGLGLGLWARARGDTSLATLAFGGAFLHLWSHSAMKTLLFLGAGSVLHGAREKRLDRLGGLLARMPWTGGAILVGAIAIAGLPPLTGFTGEWLLYRALSQAGTSSAAAPALLAISGAAALALAGGLAALCFVRFAGVALLGSARSDAAAAAHESPPVMIAPLALLAAACLAGGLLAPALIALQGTLLRQLGVDDVAPAASLLQPVVLASGALLVAAAALLTFTRRPPPATVETWGCGYLAPSARMQYTGSGFSELLVARVLPRWLRSARGADPFTRKVYEPLLRRTAHQFARLRVLQQGNVHVYLLYIVATAIAAVAWVTLR